MGTLVGVRELKNQLSRYLQEAKQGRSITVTERGKPVAILGPTSESPDAQVVRELVRESLGTWEGGIWILILTVQPIYLLIMASPAIFRYLRITMGTGL